MARLEFEVKRAIRHEIENACIETCHMLHQHTIENMINQRINEIAEETAQGTHRPVNWRQRVLDAAFSEEQVRKEWEVAGPKMAAAPHTFDDDE